MDRMTGRTGFRADVLTTEALSTAGIWIGSLGRRLGSTPSGSVMEGGDRIEKKRGNQRVSNFTFTRMVSQPS
jgi:hypothetical protein